MDLITALPKTTSGHDAVLVFVDRMTKAIKCAPTTKQVGAQGTARLFKETIYRHYGLPEVIIADRDPRWNSLFWRSVFQSLQTRTRLSTAYHPQTDGQTERANRTIEEMLRSYVHPFGDDWDQHLADAEFSYNNSEQRSTGQTPFYLLHGFHARTPLDLYNPTAVEETPAAKQFVKQMLDGHQAAKAAMEQASKRQKEQYDRKRTAVSFKRGDWVLLSARNYRFQGRTDKLSQQFLGPYKIKAMNVSGLAATLELPRGVKVHSTINVSRLKRYEGDRLPDGTPVERARGDFDVEDDHVEEASPTQNLEVETVIAWRDVEASKPPHRVLRQEYLVKWQGHEDDDNTWVARSALKNEQEKWFFFKEAGYLDEEPSVRKPR